MTSQVVVGNPARTVVWSFATNCNGRLPAGGFQRTQRLRAENYRNCDTIRDMPPATVTGSERRSD